MLQQPLVTHYNKCKPYKPCIAITIQSFILPNNTTQINHGTNNNSD